MRACDRPGRAGPLGRPTLPIVPGRPALPVGYLPRYRTHSPSML